MRINGSKGMLALKPFGRDGNAQLEWQTECSLMLRESMVKSYKEWKRLYVVKLADRLAGTINRQIVINMIGMDRSLGPKLWGRVVKQYNDIIRMPFDVKLTRK